MVRPLRHPSSPRAVPAWNIVDVHPRRLHRHLRVVHRLAEKVVRAHRARHVLARTIPVRRFLVRARQFHRDLELRQHVTLHVQRHLGAILIHQRAHVVCPQIHLIGQPEFRRRDPELVRLRRFLEHLVAARILHFERQAPRRHRIVPRPVQRQRTHVNRLSRLVNRLLRRQQNRCLVLQPHLLRKLRAPDRRIRHIPQRVAPSRRRQPEFRPRRAARIQSTRK